MLINNTKEAKNHLQYFLNSMGSILLEGSVRILTQQRCGSGKHLMQSRAALADLQFGQPGRPAAEST